MFTEGAEGAATNWQTKGRAQGGPGNKTLVHLMRGVIKGGRRTKADGIKGNSSKTKTVHSCELFPASVSCDSCALALSPPVMSCFFLQGRIEVDKKLWELSVDFASCAQKSKSRMELQVYDTTQYGLCGLNL